jgi:hypothetical protein
MPLVLCPCEPCHQKSVGGAVMGTDPRTRKNHLKEIMAGTRRRYRKVDSPSTASSKKSGTTTTPSESRDSMFSCDIVSAVADGRMTAVGAGAILKSMENNYGEVLRDSGFSPPLSLYKAKQQTFGKNEAVWFTRDYCPVCGYGFPIRITIVGCPRCKKDTRYDDTTGKAGCQAFYADLDDKVCRLMKSSDFADGPLRFGKKKQEPAEAIVDRELVDVFDGRAMKEFYHDLEDDDKDNFLYFLLCQDGVEISKNVSYTPVTAKLLNWPSKLRSLLGNIILLGFFPPHVKDYTAMLAPIADMLARHQPGAVPIDVSDTNDLHAKAWYYLAVTVTDIRGCPAVSCGKSPPCYVGGCNSCEVCGIRPTGKGPTIMPGAVRAVKKNTTEGKRIRLAYANEFKNVPTMNSYHMMTWPKTRVHEEAVTEGRTEEIRVGNKMYAKSTLSKARQKIAFHGVDAFSKALKYWDKIRCVVYDHAHEHANVIKQIVNLIQDNDRKGKCLFNDVVRQYEAQKRPGMHQYRNILKKKKPEDKKNVRRYTHKRPDWQADQDGKTRLDKLKDFCRVPSVFPPVRRWLKNVGFVKCTEWYLLTGDGGAYFIRASGIRGPVRTLWIRLLRLMEMTMRKVSTPGDRQNIKENLPNILASLEIELPLSWNTSVIHIFACQTVRLLEEWGPFCEMSMLDFERYHTKFKNMARSSKDLMTSISNTYKYKEACADKRHLMSIEDQQMLSRPHRSTTQGLHAQHASSDKADRCTRVLGRGHGERLTDAELDYVNKLWSVVPEVAHLPANTNKSILLYNRAEYAGSTFCTEGYRQRARTKIDNTHVRMDYLIDISSRRVVSQQRVVSIFGTITRIFQHEFEGSGLTKIVLQCRWFKTIGTCSIAGTTLVQEVSNPSNSALDPDDQFTFLETVFQLPVAVWPHNELSGGVTREGGDVYDIIDRNQEQYNHFRDTIDILASPDVIPDKIEGVEEAEEEHGGANPERNQRGKLSKKRKRQEEESASSDESESENNDGKDSSSEDEDIEAPETSTPWNGGKDTICSYCFQSVDVSITDVVSCTACPRVYHRNTCAMISPTYRQNVTPVLCKKLYIVHDNDDEKELIHRLSKCTNRVDIIED